MKKIIFMALFVCVIAGVTAYADSDATAAPKPTTTPVEIAKETGLSDYDWQRIFEWETNGKKKYKGLSTREKFEYFYTLVSRGYFEDEKREFLDNYDEAQNNSKSEVVLYLSENTLSNGKTLEDTWIYDTLKLEEWNDYVLFANRISDEKISEANGVYTFNIFSKVIEWAEQGGREAVTYKKNSNILPDQNVIITLDKNSNGNNPSGTVSVVENGVEIVRCDIDKIEAANSAQYTYFISPERSRQEFAAEQKENGKPYTENGKQYRFATLTKKPDVEAYFSFKETDNNNTDIVKEVSSNGEFTVDYYVLDTKAKYRNNRYIEIIVISGDKGEIAYYKRKGFNISVPTAQSVMLGGEQYIRMEYDKVTNYYDNKDNNGEYTLELSHDDNAYLTMSYGTYEKPEYKIQLDVDDLHITKTYEKMTDYSDNMPMYWYDSTGGKVDLSPEGKKLLEEIGEEHTDYYWDSSKSTAAPIVTSDPPAPTKAPLTVKGGDNITISVGDEKIVFPDAQPFIDENDRTQVPIRAVAEMLDCTVDWNKDTETAIITREDGRTATLTIGSDVMIVNNTETNIPVQMDTAAIIKDERTYIPVRFVAEAMGLTVEWSK